MTVADNSRAILTSSDFIEVLVAMMVQIDTKKINDDLLRHLIKYGVITDTESAEQTIERIELARKRVQGQTIRVREAVERYGFANATLYKWRNDGWIRVVEDKPAQRFDESDLAMAAEIANMIGRAAGRAVFPPKPRSGRPKKQAS
jgi:transposase